MLYVTGCLEEAGVIFSGTAFDKDVAVTLVILIHTINSFYNSLDQSDQNLRLRILCIFCKGEQPFFCHFQVTDGNHSRASSFAEERPFLRPLPPRPFELATWKVATVGPNYHISVERMNYSVPFEYIKQKVDVRLTKATVEVFYGGNRICSHPRLYGRFNQYSTIQEHMPPEHQKYVQWNGERFIHWAGKVGSNTQVAVQAILSGYKVEQQGYKSCMGLLKLADKYTPERLENACKRALEYTPRPSLKNIQAILASGQDKAIPEQSAATASSSRYGFTRGAAYYGRGNK